MDLNELELSKRSGGILSNLGMVKTVEELCLKTPYELRTLPQFGRKSLNEVIAKLAEHGYELATKAAPKPRPEQQDMLAAIETARNWIGRGRAVLENLTTAALTYEVLFNEAAEQHLVRDIVADRVRGLTISTIAEKHNITQEFVKRACVKALESFKNGEDVS